MFMVGVVGNNVIADPSLEEQQVSESGLCIGYNNGDIAAPVESVSLSSVDGKGFSEKALLKSFDLVRQMGSAVTNALDVIAAQNPAQVEAAF